MDKIIWLFPILFMVHDFEEIILLQAWLAKNRQYLSERFPKLSKRLFYHFASITTPAFALGVAEEFILISIITIAAYETNWYNLWIGLFIAFTLHLVIHCIQALIVKKYIPAVFTSIICLPICLIIIKYIVVVFPISTVFWYSVFGFIIMVVNLIILHKGMGLFTDWLAKYGQLQTKK
jgi:predicted Abi (CAAX) family protease